MSETSRRLDSLPPRHAAVIAHKIYRDTEYALSRLKGCAHPSPAVRKILDAVESQSRHKVLAGFDDLSREILDDA